MAVAPPGPRALRATLSRALHPAVPDCGGHAPAAFSDPAYAAGAQSPDEAAIVDVLVTRVRPGDRLLHVGVGSSKLVARLVPLGVHVDGLTLSPAELDAARALGLPGYVVALLDKHRLAQGDVPGP